MNKSFFAFLARKKIVIIFFLAIILPSLVIAYLSIKTFSQRRETVQQILESNLWISGNTALQSFENALLEREKDVLSNKNFADLLKRSQVRSIPLDSNSFVNSQDGRYFLLDEDNNILMPRTGIDGKPEFFEDMDSSQLSIKNTYRQAENFEFAEKNHARATELYQEYYQKASSGQHKAAALEAMGRCFVAMKKYDRAVEIYGLLIKDFNHLENKAGHPFGIVASLQLYEISKHQKKDKESFDDLIHLYDDIKNGKWFIDIPAYDLFTEEMEAEIENRLGENHLHETQAYYRSLQNKTSPYLESLIFAEFLKTKIIPRIKENVSLTPVTKKDQTKRLLAHHRDQSYMISYKTFPRTGMESQGGFCWNLQSLKDNHIPRILKNIEKETGLQVTIIDESGGSSNKNNFSDSSSLALAFRRFPLPWQFTVSQPGLGDLQQTAQRDVFAYGILFFVIVTLLALGAILIARDITREKEATRLKTEFVHNVSHELKTPLTLIRLYGETLQRKKNLSALQKDECYEIITKESERLSHLINNVLDFSRIDMGRKEFDFQKGNLAEAIKETFESYRYHLEKKGFSVRHRIDSHFPDTLFDREAISSVLINLLSNAVKFSPDKKEVTVRLLEENGRAVIQVSDKGIGIDPKEIKKIFTRFYRSKNKVSSDAKGSGLGLTLVKHITEAHGGWVAVESEPGEGTTFSVILPFDGG
jgi:signal transduction histidine kinase/tetratricopeptide (TPR) repeat protein